MRIPFIGEVVRKEEYDALKLIVQSNFSVPISGLDSTDSEPTDEAKRKEYCIEVDNFFEMILKDKLITSIADFRGLLSNVGMQEGIPTNMPRSEYDSFLRGMEASMWKLHGWCLLMQAERKSYLIKQD